MPRRLEVDLTPQAVEQVAMRVAQLLDKRREDSEQDPLSAGELALKLKVERPWVYRNRHLLGGMRLGDGPKAQWRFDYRAALKALRELEAGRAEGGDRR